MILVGTPKQWLSVIASLAHFNEPVPARLRRHASATTVASGETIASTMVQSLRAGVRTFLGCMSRSVQQRCLVERMAGADVRVGTEPDREIDAILNDSYGQLRRFAAVAGPLELPPDDLVHDAIEAVLQRGGFDGVGDPVAYMKRTILNLASNERRRLGRRRAALTRLHSGSRDGEIDAYPSDLAYLNALSPDARAVLFMHYVEGDSFERIASTLGKRASTVRQIATRGRRQLRKMGAEL